MRLRDLADKRVAIWGYGREGRAALAALQKQMPQQAVTLFCSENEALSARPSVAGSRTLSITTSPPDASMLSRFDIIIKSPGISAYRTPVPEAENAGVQFTSASALWFAENPHARTICVTGTKGKSTVSALIAHMVRKSGKCIALAGNIGVPMLELTDTTRLPDWWVIEQSSFQTRDFDGAPTIAVITNLYEEHLDWHVTRENYVADKLAIGKRAACLVVANQPMLLEKTAWHSNRRVFGTASGWHVADDWICRGDARVLALSVVPLRGMHNALNVCASLDVIEAAGLDAQTLAKHVSSFCALPHRLQALGRSGEHDYVNDSISTTPYATVEALRAFAGRDIVVLVGGFDRGVDWNVFVEHVRNNPPHAIVTMGANGARIAALLAQVRNPGFVLDSVNSLDQAVQRARAQVPTGGVVLLSPGAPSFDAFRDYAQRGDAFAQLAGFSVEATQIVGLGIA